MATASRSEPAPRVDTGSVPTGDLLDLGGGRRAAPRWPRWLLVSVAGLVAAVGFAQLPRPGPVPAAAPVTPAPSPTTSAPPVAVTTLGHSLLGVTGRWELFGRGDGRVVRIELARGRVTMTTLPVLLSDAPVSFVVTGDRALVRSLDEVPAYVVPDGRPARPMPPSLGRAGPAFAGPRPGTVWVQATEGPRPVLELHQAAGGPALAAIRVPEDNGLWEAGPDGTGRLVFRITGGVYLAGPSGLRRITTGALLAAGATRWLTLECDDAHRCRTVVTDRATGRHRALPVGLGVGVPRGAIAPDGRTAAMFRVGPGGTVTPYLLDLGTGATRLIGLRLDQAAGEGTVVWSPDSRWLFAAGADGQIRAIDPATGQVTMLGVGLPELSQLAVRAA